MLVYPAESYVVDLDADGFARGVDCDDNNPAATPAAVERAGDGVDNDCDPTTPDDGAGSVAASSGRAR